MLRVLTKAEELAMRAENFARLRAGMLFDLGRRRSFIAVRKRGRTVEVVELDPANIGRILHGKPCVHTRLRFDDMGCLNLHLPRELTHISERHDHRERRRRRSGVGSKISNQ